MIVVGAGAAGLCVAYELQRKGFEVIVLEAQEQTLPFGHVALGFFNGQKSRKIPLL